MLRITNVADGPGATVRLEGKLLGPWVEEVSAACRAATARAPRLDLSGVTFVDAAGARLLRDLLRDGARFAACSGFVAALLAQEGQR